MKVILKALVAITLSLGAVFASAETIQLLSPIPELTAQEHKELTCLAKNIYFEAGGESFEGKIAVAMVTLNRIESERFPDTICEVVHQRTVISNGVVVCQFSWTCQGNRIKTSIGERWQQAMDVARLVLLDGYRNPNLKNALYFHNIYVNPKWNLEKITSIGNHIFYGERTKRVSKSDTTK